MECEELLRERLVTREQQPARVAAGVRLAHELEECHDVLVVRDDAVEFLEQVEDDFGLPFRDRGAKLSEAVEHADAAHLVAHLAQRAGDVVLGTPLVDFFLAMTFERLGGNQARMNDDERTKFLHRGRCGVSP